METNQNNFRLILIIIFFIIFDIIWLGIIKRKFYLNKIHEISGKPANLNIISIAFVYLLMAIVLWYFTKNASSTSEVAIKSALLELGIYATFNITLHNMTPDVWNIKTGLMDTIWGVSLFSVVGLLGYIVTK